MLDLLINLVERFEERQYAIPEGDPVGALELLMESNGLKAADLADLFGSRGRISDVLSRRRTIRKNRRSDAESDLTYRPQSSFDS